MRLPPKQGQPHELNELVQQPAQMPLLERDHLVKQVPSQTAYPSLATLSAGTAKSSAQRLAAHGLNVLRHVTEDSA